MEIRRVYISATRPIRAEDGLSPQLGDALSAWRQEGEEWIGVGMGATPGPSETRLRACVDAGEALAGQVSAELGDDV